jgi:hypothetical protein
MRALGLVAMVALFITIGCRAEKAALRGPPVDSGGGAMSMRGMHGAMQGLPMMPMMQGHMDSLGMMSPGQMSSMMARHQAMAGRMLEAMRQDVAGLNRAPDPAWTALADSVQKDLADLPGLSGAALQSRMQAHRDRMHRLMAMYQGMMSH